MNPSHLENRPEKQSRFDEFQLACPMAAKEKPTVHETSLRKSTGRTFLLPPGKATATIRHLMGGGVVVKTVINAMTFEGSTTANPPLGMLSGVVVLKANVNVGGVVKQSLASAEAASASRSASRPRPPVQDDRASRHIPNRHKYLRRWMIGRQPASTPTAQALGFNLLSTRAVLCSLVTAKKLPASMPDSLSYRFRLGRFSADRSEASSCG
jgi:hypothetical protein